VSVPSALVGPGFSTYHPEDVAWLLSDLSALPLEGDVTMREVEIQAGRRHYSETLPIEYAPSAAYLDAYRHALASQSLTVAVAIRVLAEAILATRGPQVVLVSLARAGVPIGILLRRWLLRRGVDGRHFALSIIRDRGIDRLALDAILQEVDAAHVQFVDGWTGKGVIADTLTNAIEAYVTARPAAARLSSDLAVLSDPIGVAALSATGRDLLIPSALLNATVSGLVSRTVLNDQFVGPGMFHGAKFYRELIAEDRSREFIDTIVSRFDEADRVDPATLLGDDAPKVTTATLPLLMDRLGVDDPHRLKPGIGETTRMLLRRVPERVFVDPLRADDLEHVRVLAEMRGVPTTIDTRLPWACVGVVARRGGGA